MTQHMFAVYDAKAQAYLAPFPANTHGIAERMFADLVNADGHQFNRHPADYTLYKIGTFDTDTSELTSCELQPLATGLQVRHDADTLNLPV